MALPKSSDLLTPIPTVGGRPDPLQAARDLRRYGDFLEKLVLLCRQEGMLLTEFTHRVPEDDHTIPQMRVVLGVHAGMLPAQVDSGEQPTITFDIY